MWANNEVGTVQPVDEVVALAAEHGIPVHTDAVQAVGAAAASTSPPPASTRSTLTGHKVGGPYGVGALVVRRERRRHRRSLHGGGQERDIRSGTLDTPGDRRLRRRHRVRREASRPSTPSRVSALRDDLVARVVARGARRAPANGDPDRPAARQRALLAFPGCEGDSLLMLLDARGIECSTGSACSAGVPQPSHVLLAMGCRDEQARHSLRFSLGHTSTRPTSTPLVAAIGPVVERARQPRRA